MSYRHKSGFQKRKERASRENRNAIAQQTQRTLTEFNVFRMPTAEIKAPTLCNAPNHEDANSFVLSDQDQENIAPETEMIVQDATAEIIRSIRCTEPHQDQENGIPKIEIFVSEACEMLDHECTSILNDYDNDIGYEQANFFNPQKVDVVIRRGHQSMPTTFPRDVSNELFPMSLLYRQLPNGEKVQRDWLVWSSMKNAFYCLPCRLFSHKLLHRSLLSCPDGYSKNLKWKKCYDRFPSHENSEDHIHCYIQWREREISIKNESSIDTLICNQMKDETKKWKLILTRILDTILFLGERGLALRGESHLVGEKNNGNFLGLLELIGHYDPLLNDHLEKVKASQKSHQRLQVHYLSPDIQNEFIHICARHVISVILKEREIAKYYAIIVDGTPDSAHIEQTTFILRYLLWNAEQKKYTIEERFLAFVDCNKKTGEVIADLIKSTLKTHKIPFIDCRGQGYDNGSNMKGIYKGVQSLLLQENPLADYSPCGTHTLNLIGVDSAECCIKAITFFGVVQKCYCIFSRSPQRWEILKHHIGSSLHCLSDTRWSARIDAVKPFANHLPGLQAALEDIMSLNLTADTRRDVNGILTYIRKFECVLMASIWCKILTAIDERNVVLQARNATIDVEVKNLQSLVEDLQFIRRQWDSILRECELVASGLNGTSNSIPPIRKRKRVRDFFEREAGDEQTLDEINEFKINTFFVIIDSVIEGISHRFKAVNKLNNTFGFLWKFTEMDEEEIRKAAASFVKKYAVDVSAELGDEVIHLKHIYEANFEANLPPFELLNAITSKNLHNLFPNVCIALRIFCTLPVTVASGERSFSALARIKNAHRSCSMQMRLTGLGTLCVESQLAKTLNFDDIIDDFATSKARKAFLK